MVWVRMAAACFLSLACLAADRKAEPSREHPAARAGPPRPASWRAFPDSRAAFARWNPWVHGGGEAELYLGSGRRDKCGLAEPAARFEEKVKKPGWKVAFGVRDGGHDWASRAPEFQRLTPRFSGLAELVP